MPDTIAPLGIRLQLLIGRPDLPLPAPYEVIDALTGLSVTNNDRSRDGFELNFRIGRNSPTDYSLLSSGCLDVENHVIIMVFFGARPQVLIDGIITDLQLENSGEPGRSQLIVIGEDISVKLSFEDRNETYPNQSDSTIVRRILAGANFVPQVTETRDTPNQTDRVPTQQCDDLRFIRSLASRNGFIFYVEPTDLPGMNVAYWGPENRQTPPQPPLTINMGPSSNIFTPINFHYNGLGPVETEVAVLNEASRDAQPVQPETSTQRSLAEQPARPLRRSIARNTAHLSYTRAGQRANMAPAEAMDALEATGEMEAARYGQALRARRLVNVCGAGSSYDGLYYVKQVKHVIRRFPSPDYKMQFTLTREGRGTTSSIIQGIS